MLWQIEATTTRTIPAPDEEDLPNDLKKIAEILEGVESPVHPTEVFDMIVGTSTGKSEYRICSCEF